MREKKRVFFPILLKVILLGVITSFIASTIAIVVSYNNMIKKAKDDLDVAANDALEYANRFYDSDNVDTGPNFASFNYVKNYVLNLYKTIDEVRNTELKDKDSFLEFEKVFSQGLPYFYVEGMFMTPDYMDFKNNYTNIYQTLLNAAFYSEQSAYYAFKDPDNENRLIFLTDSRLTVLKHKNIFYHCPGTHYDIKEDDNIFDIGHSYIKGYRLNDFNTRFIEIKGLNDYGDIETAGYAFIEYDTSKVEDSYKNILKNEILILSATSLAVILLYAILSYLMFVKNINKLNKVAVDISSQLEQNKTFESIHPNITSHDEMKTLGDSFLAMENKLVNYVEIIRNDAQEKERINAELSIASKIQLESLPASSYSDSNCKINAFIKTAKEVGGDFYDYFYLDDNRVVVAICDVSGKGVPAALFMMKGKELIKSNIRSGSSLEEALYQANNALCKDNDENLFITAFVSIVDLKKHEMIYVNAGHEKPCILSRDKVNKLDGTSNFVLGGVDDFEYKSEKISLDSGDRLFLFTDGLNEAINSQEEEFSYERVEQTLKDNLNSSNEEIISNMIKAQEAFVNNEEVFDDVTMVVFQMNGNKLHLSYGKEDVSIIEEIVNKFESTFPYLTNKEKSEAGIIIDEIVNNIISYSENEKLEFSIDFEMKDNKLTIVFTDNGKKFNPLNRKDKYLNGYTDDVEIGGFGISLVKSLSKSQKYEYKNKKNIFTVIK